MTVTICRIMEKKEGLVQVKVTDNGHLCWCQVHLSGNNIRLSSDALAIPPEDILHVRVKGRKRKVSPSKSHPDQTNPTPQRTHVLLVSQIARKAKTKLLRVKTSAFFGTSVECQALASDICKKREGMGLRPLRTDRHLLVLVNPIGGRGKGVTIFKEQVEPLLNACEIGTEVIVTTRAAQMTAIVQEKSLSGFDGIVVLGGDGSCNEVIAGLLTRYSTAAGHNVEDYRTQIVPVEIPIGFIPAGSGNWLAWQFYGVPDVITATINVIQGDVVKMSASTTHDPNQLLGFSCLVHHIGFIGDLIRQCELNRWMGPARYSVTPQFCLLKRRLMSARLKLYPVEVEDAIAPANTRPGTTHRIEDNSLRVRDAAGLEEGIDSYPGSPLWDSSTDIGEPEELETYNMSPDPTTRSAAGRDGKYANLIQAFADPTSRTNESLPPLFDVATKTRVPSFSWDKDENAEILDVELYNMYIDVTRTLSENGNFKLHIGNDSMCVQVDKKCSLSDFVKHLTKVRDNTPGMVDYKFVECRKVQALQLTLSTKESKDQTWYINSDGQSVTLKAETYYVRLHPRVLSVFCGGVIS